jgi:multiple sugar transport system ATP-binding protein
MAGVKFEGVSKRFGDVVAVNDLSLEIEDKEFLVLLGPSGCGKTTTLRLLAGLEDPTSGEIYIGDRVVNDVAPKDRDIAMVFQSYALYPHMSVYDNMAFGLRLRKVPKVDVDRRVKEAAGMLEIEDLLDRRPRQLSGGQRQRVAVGRAIVREPQVFLMDEPLSNLDAKLRVLARANLSKLHQRLETTFVYVTHDQVEAMTMASRIAVQKDGLLLQVGTPDELYERPANIFVAGFIGSPAMNFFEATLKPTDGDVRVDVGPFELSAPPEKRKSLAKYVGKKMILGIRPNDIYDTNFAPPLKSPSSIKAQVDVIEPMGDQAYLYLAAGDNIFIARVDPRTEARVGKEVEMLVNMDNMHIFDPETELAIR